MFALFWFVPSSLPPVCTDHLKYEKCRLEEAVVEEVDEVEDSTEAEDLAVVVAEAEEGSVAVAEEGSVVEEEVAEGVLTDSKTMDLQNMLLVRSSHKSVVGEHMLEKLASVR